MGRAKNKLVQGLLCWSMNLPVDEFTLFGLLFYMLLWGKLDYVRTWKAIYLLAQVSHSLLTRLGIFFGTALAEAKEAQWNLRTRTTCPNKGFQALGFQTIAL